jgi:hypothetical protein
MKTGDETVDSMFDEITETKIAPDGTATSKRYATDDGTIREMDFAEACDEYVRAARKFEKLDRIAKAQKGIPDNLCAWFDAWRSSTKLTKDCGCCSSAQTAPGAAT